MRNLLYQCGERGLPAVQAVVNETELVNWFLGMERPPVDEREWLATAVCIIFIHSGFALASARC